jgi:hypothetical protein
MGVGIEKTQMYQAFSACGCRAKRGRDLTSTGESSGESKKIPRETPKSSVRRERRTGGFGVGRNSEEVCDVCC